MKCSSVRDSAIILYDLYNLFQLLMCNSFRTSLAVSSVAWIPELLFCKALSIMFSTPRMSFMETVKHGVWATYNPISFLDSGYMLRDVSDLQIVICLIIAMILSMDFTQFFYLLMLFFCLRRKIKYKPITTNTFMQK